MARRRKRLWWGLGILIVATLVIGNVLKGREPELKVEAERIERRDLRAVVSASGWIEPHRQVDVSSATAGKVVELAVDEGDTVTAGQLLLRIDPVPFRGQVDQLRAAVAAARADHDAAAATVAERENERERMEALAARGLASSTELETARRDAERAQAGAGAARARLEQQLALLRTAEHDLDQVTITAAMSGVVTRLNIDEGETVVTGTMNNPGTVLLTIADLGFMEARIQVDETDVVDLSIGQEAEITIDAFPDTTLRGVVSEVGSSAIRGAGRASETSADFEVVVRLIDLIPGLRPGLSATADIVTDRRSSVPSVTIGALSYRDPEAEARHAERREGAGKGEAEDGGTAAALAGDEEDRGEDGARRRRECYGLFVIEDGRARFVPVTIGITGDRHIELTGGLDEGTQVISGPFKTLRELKSGDRVKPARGTGGREHGR